ncbi:MAG: helix-turn-helix domain-containing protein, partial [Thermoplasmata archaeon]
MRLAPTIVLSPEERVVLTRWAENARPTDARAVRARIVLAAAGGMENVEVARVVRVHRLTVARWRRRFLVSRLRGVGQGTAASPRPAKISEETVRAIVRRTVSAAPIATAPWTTRALGRQYGVSHTSVRRIWEAYRVRPVGHRPWPIRPDPDSALVPCEVVGVFLNPPDYALATLLRRADPLGSDLIACALPPTVTSHRADPVSLASHPLHPVLSDLPDAGHDPSAARRRSKELLGFLSGVHQQLGPLADVRIVATEPGRSGDAGVDRWRVRHPNFRIDFVPDMGIWRRRAFLDIELVGRARGPLGRPAAKLASGRSLAQSLESYSSSAVPFEWVATRREVQRGKAAPLLRYELASSGHPSLAIDPSTVASGYSDAPAAETARAMARAVLQRCLRVRRGERVLIQSWTGTQGYANGFVIECRRLGALPLLLHEDEATYWASAMECRPEHLSRLGEHCRAALERSDVLVSFFGPSDRARYHALLPKVRSRLGEYQDALFRAAARAGGRAVQMAIGRASPASARFYGVDLAAWRSELVEGALVEPRELRRRAHRLLGPLAHGRSIEITHPNGTDLRLRLKQRLPQVSDGEVPASQLPGEW